MNHMTWKDLQSRCYAPYSGRNDVCMVQGASGTLYPGVRVENISFPLTVDAVQAALFSCLSEGDTPRKLIMPASSNQEQDGESSGSAGKIPASDPADHSAAHVCSAAELRYWCDQFKLACNQHEQPEGGHPSRTFRTSENQTGIQRLKELTTRCVIPYSFFPVTALLVSDAGIFSGVNIEVSDWQKGLCAERVAMAKARAAGAASFREIHVYAPQSDYVSPCGACRQILIEHMADGSMYMHHNDSEITRLSIADLLPYQFKAGQLGQQS